MSARRALAGLGVSVAVLALVALAATYWLYSTQRGLEFAVRELLARAGDRLVLEGVRGALGSELSIDQVRYDDGDTRLTASNVRVRWSPSALLSRRIHLRTFSADTIVVTTKPSDKPATVPESLVLPVGLAVDEAVVDRLEIRRGEEAPLTLLALRLGYEGDASRHVVQDLSMTTAWGAVRGDAQIDATRPYALDVSGSLAGTEALQQAQIGATLKGELEAATLELHASSGSARADLRADVKPFAPVKVSAVDGNLSELDLQVFSAKAPQTRIEARFRVDPLPDGALHGTVEARNALAGPFDAERLPLATASAEFGYAGETLTLDKLAVRLERGGRLDGRGRVAASGSDWTLALSDVNLGAIESKLRPTRLNGTIEARVEKNVQRVRGDIRDRDLAATFAAVVRGTRVELERARLLVARGVVEGSGNFDWTGAQRFELAVKATSLDPSALGDYPRASLSGDATARGSLKPDWVADASVRLAEGSVLRGVRVSGRGKAKIAPTRVRDADIALDIGGNALTLKGASGSKGDALDFTVEAPKLDVVARAFPGIDVAGQARGSGTIAGPWQAPIVAFSVAAQGLRYGRDYSATHITASGRLAPLSRNGGDPLQAKLDADALRGGGLALEHASVDIAGTVAQHTAALDVSYRNGGVAAKLEGGLAWNGSDPRWRGTVSALESRGSYAVKLTAPSALDLAPGRIQIAKAEARFQGGALSLQKFTYDHGRLDTGGTFSALPAAFLIALGGASDRVDSTLTLDGEFSLVATPELQGTVVIRRRDGDIQPHNEPALALGMSALEVQARSGAGRLEVRLTTQTRFGSADLTAMSRQTTDTSGRFDRDAPLALTARADVTSLRPLQALLGTTAIVDGRLALALQGSGTVRNVKLTGTVNGDALRLSSPQYGVALADGRIRARLADGAVTLDELGFKAGDGSFSAQGTLPGIADVASQGSIRWTAKQLRLFARPDAHLVVSGAGTLELSRSRVKLAGDLAADDGHFEYRPSRPDRLGNDVVVRGRAREQAPRSDDVDIPFAVDLGLDFARKITFVAEGLDARLDGKIRVATDGKAPLQATGTIYTAYGVFTALGQRLSVERGRFLFNGPLDNPGIDILALRKNLAVEAGVAITGTVRVPIVQLTSNPQVPDNEKLSWLVLGHGTQSANSTEMAALQVAMASLGGSGPSLTQRIANRFGVDDISVTSADTSNASSASSPANQVVAISKRLSDRIAIVYEQGLALSNNAVKIEYTLTPTVTLRAQAGVVTGFGIYYNRSYD